MVLLLFHVQVFPIACNYGCLWLYVNDAGRGLVCKENVRQWVVVGAANEKGVIYFYAVFHILMKLTAH